MKSPMEIFDWFGVSMIDALQTLKVSEPDLIYHKIEGDEFIEVHEKGISFIRMIIGVSFSMFEFFSNPIMIF